MASTISAGTTTTTALVQTADTSGVLQLQTNGTTTAVTIDTSQNVGVGTNSPATKIHVSSAAAALLTLQNTNASDDNVQLRYIGSSGNRWIVGNNITGGTGLNFDIYDWANSALRMRIDSSGNLLVGITSYSAQNANYLALQTSGGNLVTAHASGTPSGYQYAAYLYNASVIGSITQNGTTGVLYNTTSDYRLKSNVVPVTTGLSVINQLNPVNFTWISDNETDTGFLAHEFQAIIPRAVTGTKDATIEEEYQITPAVKDEQGNITTPVVMGTRTVPVYQQMDNSGAVPYLVAAIKELSAQVTTLQTQVTALQAKG
jgi:hypothetical protein